MRHIYNYLQNIFKGFRDLEGEHNILNYLLAAILITIPLNYAFSSIATILFIVVSFSLCKIKFSFKTSLMLPLFLYLLMLVSLTWSIDTKLSFSGLQKEASFLFLPLPFLLLPQLRNISKEKIFRLFGFGMVFFAVYYIGKAIFRYLATGDSSVFFYHELVTKDLNAIYVSVFTSLAIFYFIAIKEKRLKEKAALIVLIILVFLLSSKSIITIDFLLIICYYSFFLSIPRSVKVTTVAVVITFVGFSITFVKKVKDRFLLEYETAFVDNTINNTIGNEKEKVYNVSLNQAWRKPKFEMNNFFPGTALRVYQIRVFKEIITEQQAFFTGFGLEASQEKIREKALEHNLYPGYGEFNFHNQYLQTFAELGFFGFILLLAMLFMNLKNAVKDKDFLHIAFAITMIILFLTESFFCRQRGIIFFMIAYCIFNGTAGILKEKELK